MCAAIRGNGELISSHFASLARIIEHYGVLDGAAGGSSASITIFLTESVLMNPLIHNCGGQPCSDTDSIIRAALLLKSFPGYLAHLTTTDEAVALFQLQSLLAKLDTQNIESLLETDIDAALDALERLLTSADLRELITPAVITTLQQSLPFMSPTLSRESKTLEASRSIPLRFSSGQESLTLQVSARKLVVRRAFMLVMVLQTMMRWRVFSITVPWWAAAWIGFLPRHWMQEGLAAALPLAPCSAKSQ